MDRTTLRDFGMQSFYVPFLRINIVRKSHFQKILKKLDAKGYRQAIIVLENYYEQRTIAILGIIILWLKR